MADQFKPFIAIIVFKKNLFNCNVIFCKNDMYCVIISASFKFLTIYKLISFSHANQ